MKINYLLKKREWSGVIEIDSLSSCSLFEKFLESHKVQDLSIFSDFKLLHNRYLEIFELVKNAR